MVGKKCKVAVTLDVDIADLEKAKELLLLLSDDVAGHPLTATLHLLDAVHDAVTASVPLSAEKPATRPKPQKSPAKKKPKRKKQDAEERDAAGDARDPGHSPEVVEGERGDHPAAAA